MSKFTGVSCSRPFHGKLSFFFFVSALIFTIFTIHVYQACAGPLRAINNSAKLPSVYGKVIYQTGRSGKGDLYIIGIGHRDTFTRSNGKNTAEIQAEVYEIGKWLIENKGVELLLPEGFFSSGKNGGTNNIAAGNGPQPVTGDMESVERELGGTIFINAEELLTKNFNVIIQQVEDYGLYKDVMTGIIMLEKSSGDPFGYIYKKMDLEYLQERRTAAILQRVPGIVESQISDGNITDRRAILTIGASHLPQIIAGLRLNKLIIHSPAFSRFKDYTSDVNLLKKDFRVTVIIPKAIAEDNSVTHLIRLADYNK